MGVHKPVFINIWTEKKDVSSWMEPFGLVQKDILKYRGQKIAASTSCY